MCWCVITALRLARVSVSRRMKNMATSRQSYTAIHYSFRHQSLNYLRQSAYCLHKYCIRAEQLFHKTNWYFVFHFVFCFCLYSVSLSPYRYHEWNFFMTFSFCALTAAVKRKLLNFSCFMFDDVCCACFFSSIHSVAIAPPASFMHA